MAAPIPLPEPVTMFVRTMSYCQPDLRMLTECDLASEALDLARYQLDVYWR